MTSLAEALKQEPIKALLFDLDDTLYDSKPIYALGLDRAWAVFHQSSAGKGIDRRQFNDLYASARQKTKTSLAHSPSKNSRLIYFHHLVMAVRGAPLASLVFELDNAYASAYDSIDFTQTRELIRSLKSKFRIAVITNQTVQAQFRKLANLDPRGDLIDVMMASEGAGFEKPDSRIFKATLEELRLKPSEVVMIGDAHDHDIAGAQSLGMHCLHICNDPGLSSVLIEQKPILGRCGNLSQMAALFGTY